MASYIFSSPSFLNSTLYSPPLGTNYHICTTSSSLGRQHTFVTPESDAHAAHGAPSGVIHWDLLAFEIDGERKCIVPDLRTDVEPSGEIPVTGMRSCRWCWDRHGEFESEHETKLRGTQIFVVTWLNDQWIVRDMFFLLAFLRESLFVEGDVGEEQISQCSQRRVHSA